MTRKLKTNLFFLISAKTHDSVVHTRRYIMYKDSNELPQVVLQKDLLLSLCRTVTKLDRVRQESGSTVKKEQDGN